MICITDIKNLKANINKIVGKEIIVKSSLGRSRFTIEKAIVKNTYPNIFVVQIDETDTHMTYSYTDILTRKVEVKVFDGEEYLPLNLPELPPDKQRERKLNW